MTRARVLLGTLLLPLLCARWGVCADADTAASLEKFNRAYRESRLEEAIKGYRSLIAAAPDSPALHYNLGNAYYRFGQTGSLGLAIASYQRAFALSPRNADIRHNLDFALHRAGESLVPPGTPAALFLLFQLLSAAELRVLEVAGLWAVCLLGSLWLLAPRLRPKIGTPLLAAAALWIAGAAWWGMRSASTPAKMGVILIQNAEARSGPGENFQVSFQSPEGRRVSILGEKGPWLEIGVLKEGLRGWVPADAIEKI